MENSENSKMMGKQKRQVHCVKNSEKQVHKKVSTTFYNILKACSS